VNRTVSKPAISGTKVLGFSMRENPRASVIPGPHGQLLLPPTLLGLPEHAAHVLPQLPVGAALCLPIILQLAARCRPGRTAARESRSQRQYTINDSNPNHLSRSHELLTDLMS
jgi:hypothetical protein